MGNVCLFTDNTAQAHMQILLLFWTTCFAGITGQKTGFLQMMNLFEVRMTEKREDMLCVFPFFFLCDFTVINLPGQES